MRYAAFSCPVIELEDELNKKASEGWVLSHMVALPERNKYEAHWVTVIMTKSAQPELKTEAAPVVCANCGAVNDDATREKCQQCGCQWWMTMRV